MIAPERGAGARRGGGKKRFLAMGLVIPQSRGTESTEVPSVSSLPAGSKRGYLWRLAGRRMLYRTDWKRKYFVLHQDKLYYYETERGKGGERGSGLIELKYFMDCVEAPLTDHKKATNVFLLLAAERGFFDQGRCYLSAETLIDMKDWVTRIKEVLERGGATEEQHRSLPGEVARGPRKGSTAVPEPLYSSIREESIHRSNSMSTLPSLCREMGDGEDWLNRSMDEGPVCGLGGVDHNLTYNYSSSEESLNESFSIVIGQKLPRSADSSMRAPAQSRPRPEITLQPSEPPRTDLYEDIGSTTYSTYPRHSSPNKKSTVKSSSDYLQKMYSEMARVDEQLEMVSRIETDGGSVSGLSGISCVSDSQRSAEGTAVAASQGSTSSLHKMEQMLKQVVRQSEELYGVFRQLESESAQAAGRDKEEAGLLPGAQALGVRLARYQGSLVALERQATDLMQEIRNTHTRVVQSLDEAEQARGDFLQLKEKAEFILTRLQQGEASRQPGRHSQLYEPLSGAATFPKQAVVARTEQGNKHRVNFCQDPHHPAPNSHHISPNPHNPAPLSHPATPQNHHQPSHQPQQEPLYAQPVKKADREKEKSEVMYSKPSYEVQGYRQARYSPKSGERYSTYSPKSERYPVRSPLAQEERYSPGKTSLGQEERPSPGRSPLAQEERWSPQQERPSPQQERPSKAVPSRNDTAATGSAVIYAHRKEGGQREGNMRPRSLMFPSPAKRE